MAPHFLKGNRYQVNLCELTVFCYERLYSRPKGRSFLELDDMEEQLVTKEMSDAIIATSHASHECVMTSEDAVMRWLCTQWTAAMIALLQIGSKETTDELLRHLGCISLTLERVGFENFKPFQHVAAELLRQFKVYQAEQDEPSAPSGIIH